MHTARVSGIVWVRPAQLLLATQWWRSVLCHVRVMAIVFVADTAETDTANGQKDCMTSKPSMCSCVLLRRFRTYGAKLGSLVWVFPALLYVSLISLRYQGQTSQQLAQVCFSSFPTTVVNAFSILLLGYLISWFPESLMLACTLSVLVCLTIGVAISSAG